MSSHGNVEGGFRVLDPLKCVFDGRLVRDAVRAAGLFAACLSDGGDDERNPVFTSSRGLEKRF